MCLLRRQRPAESLPGAGRSYSDLPEELFQTLLGTPNVRIERIVSLGHSSPEGFWYDRETHEWVLLLAGAALLRFEGQELIDLLPGAFVNIPAHERNRVEWTDPDQPTAWLAVHYGDPQ
ncbi:MAG TPA: phosphoribosylaminoimidazole carboxylase [Isosphaeraceae bacterium]|jgi:cupin 2 domain-containing protein